MGGVIVSAKIVSVDIGGTNTRMAMWDDGKIVKRFSVITNGQNMIETLAVVNDFIATAKPDAVGVSMPGPADLEKGAMLFVANLPNWRYKSVKEALSPSCHNIPLVFENDANLMALAHHRALKLSDSDVTQFFTVSTGLGAGLIINGRIFTGGLGYAQEIAWSPSSHVSEKNELGPHSLEYFSSGAGLSKRAERHLGLRGSKELFEKAIKGDAAAQRIIDEGIDSFATFLAIVFSVINPSHLVFDGGVARQQPKYIEAVVEKAKTMAIKEQGGVKSFIGKLGDDAALIGAFYLAKTALKDAKDLIFRSCKKDY